MKKSFLKTQVVKPADLTNDQKNQMFNVLVNHFDGQTKETFTNDLREKNWVFILTDPLSGNVYGFSTLILLKEEVGSRAVNALFSGDTIIDKKFWGRHDMFKKWLLFVLYLSQKYPEKLFWFLISKGYRTYRLLPKFYKEFYPCINKKTPKYIQDILDAFAFKKFPKEYDAKTGIIHFDYDKQRLKGGIGHVTPDKMKDSHVAFFNQQNPNHLRGDELACLARIDVKNIKILKLMPKFLISYYVSIYGWFKFRKLI